MAKKIEEVAKNYAEENVEFFFNEPRKIEEWNKTALIKVMDHKKKNADGEVAPVLSPLDYFATVRTELCYDWLLLTTQGRHLNYIF